MRRCLILSLSRSKDIEEEAVFRGSVGSDAQSSRCETLETKLERSMSFLTTIRQHELTWLASCNESVA